MDRAEAIAFVLEDAAVCPGCGHPLDETTEPGAEGAYTVSEALCAGCQVREAYADDGKNYAGRLLHVHRRDDP